MALTTQSSASTVSVSTGLQRSAAVMRALVVLTKPRINALLLFTAFCAMVVADHGLPPLRVLVPGLTGLALADAGAAAVNMWFDRDIDRIMRRTQSRPLPAGVVRPETALALGLSLGALSLWVLRTWTNALTTLLAAIGYVYYAVIYTMLLKRRTPQNIVIGGGAGAIPPLVGWAAATGQLSPAAWCMFLVILLWTPSHFWGLALDKADDYLRAGVPMMPQVRGVRATRLQMLVYATLLLAVSLLLSPMLKAPWLYGIGAGAMGAAFWWCNWRLFTSPVSDTTWARRTFVASLAYLPACFVWMVLGQLV